MIRIPTHQLPNLDCVAAFSTRDAILRKDAFHEEEDKPVPTQQDIINILSDAILNTQHIFIMAIDTAVKTALKQLLTEPESQSLSFFSAGSEGLKELSNALFSKILSIASDSFTAVTGGDELHHEGCRHIAENITANLAPTIIKYKETFLSTILTPAKNDTQTKISIKNR